MDPRFARLPAALRARSISARLGDVPALLAHPAEQWHDDGTPAPPPAPVMIWMHGRTVSKELDPGRYLRWVRQGIAACALDLPGHGERFDPSRQESDSTLETAQQMAGEIDAVLNSLADARFRRAFDTARVGIGGMSAGGMATLIRLTRPHEFRCAAVESTAGDFNAMAHFKTFFTRGGRDPAGSLARELNPAARLDGWRPIPFLALHSESDQFVPFDAIRSFVDSLRGHYRAHNADPSIVQLRSWPSTGAPGEHAGFGRVAAEAKDIQLAFLLTHLAPRPDADD